MLCGYAIPAAYFLSCVWMPDCGNSLLAFIAQQLLPAQLMGLFAAPVVASHYCSTVELCILSVSGVSTVFLSCEWVAAPTVACGASTLLFDPIEQAGPTVYWWATLVHNRCCRPVGAAECGSVSMGTVPHHDGGGLCPPNLLVWHCVVGST